MHLLKKKEEEILALTGSSTSIFGVCNYDHTFICKLVKHQIFANICNIFFLHGIHRYATYSDHIIT